MNNRIAVYVLNDFLKFERKLYSLFGINLGRSIQFKTLVYFGVVFAVLFFLSLIPILGAPVRLLPVPGYLVVAGVVAYLLSDVGTENRPPLNALVSLIRYHVQAGRGERFYKGKVIVKQQPVKFRRLPVVKDASYKNRPIFKKGAAIK